MNLKELKEIIDIVASKDTIEELEIERAGVKLRIKRSTGGSLAPAAVSPLPASAAVGPAVSTPHTPGQVSAESDDLFYIKSPIVGTFYKAPTPTSNPFVSVGDFVDKGTILCIVEAMKLMNEIESEIAGEIVAVLVDDKQPVEYGEKLFAIRPR
jgi:acetyl-CoA carboxylase biotin carboxyl carrier protein